MFVFRKRRPGAVALALLAVAAGAAAQQKAPSPPVAPAATSTVSSASVVLDAFQDLAEMPPASQTAHADRLYSQMSASAAAIRKGLSEARRRREVARAACLMDTSAQYEAAVRMARDRRFGVIDANARGDHDLATHELTILTLLEGRARRLRAAADRCLGDDVAFAEGTTVKMTAPAGPQ